MKSNEIFLFTCVRNGRPYIKKLFDSLLKQSNTNFVHFIYDNGSVDPIDDLILYYNKENLKLKKPFKIIYEKTSETVGLNMATQYCINKCDKPYFIWIDCDNWVDKNFFKHLIRAINKHPNHMLFRTALIKVDDQSGGTSSNLKERRLSTKNQNNAAFTFFTRKNRYYYSFFAINTKQFLSVSNNHILNIREYYNDEQILAYCYLAKGKFMMVKKSIGYYLSRNDSEAHLIKPLQSASRLFAYDIRTNVAKALSNEAFEYYLSIKHIFDEYNLMQDSYLNKDIHNAKLHFVELQKLSKENHFSTKVTFRSKDYLRWFVTLYIKKRFKSEKFN